MSRRSQIVPRLYSIIMKVFPNFLSNSANRKKRNKHVFFWFYGNCSWLSVLSATRSQN